jgi:sugar lactone lactonase YvrE
MCVSVTATLACNGGDRGDSAGADGSASVSASAGTDSATASASGTGEPTASGSADGTTPGSADASTAGEASSDGEFKFDLAAIPDQGPADCAQQCGETAFSYIYIANSNASTMSKINTETMTEEGRYLTRNGGGGNPSRTSVSIDGRLGSINNRNFGGTFTVWTLPELCDPMTNGQAGLQTSTGPGDVLPWGEDDCVAWFTDIPGAMRPIAWVAGQYNEDTCEYDDQWLWVATSSPVTAYRLDRDTGTILDMVPVPGVSFGYGGAADAEGNFWIISLGTELARVDADDLSVDSWVIPNGQSVYGVTVASDGNVWMSANMSSTTSAVRFTPSTQTFDYATGPVAFAQSGIAEDAQGRMWMNDWNAPYSIYPIDKNTMVTGTPFVVQGATSSAKGIAVDRNGLLWTAHFDNVAYRMDPDNDVVDTYAGLDYPYTYSDMTGGALTGVTCGSPTG